MNKKKRILLSVIGILLLIASIVGVSYAYFSSIIVGNNEAKPTVVTSGTMKIEYENTEEIRGENLLPGWTSEEKTFTVKNTGTLPVVYNIQLTNITNTFAEIIENVPGKPAELVLKLTRDGETILATLQFPTEDSVIVPMVEISPNTIHTYTMEITFKEMGIAQDYNQGRSFAGKIEIQEVEYAKTIAFEGDTSNANAPELNNGLIPVTWNGREWVKADTTKAWYNYDNGAWANAVTVTETTRNTYVTAKVNTIISMNDIETMWVWIPRYEYQYTNLGDQYAGGTQEQPGGITINFISKDTIAPSSNNFIIHDAFKWGDEENSKEQLSGIWVAKFEMSPDIQCIAAKADVGIGCDITQISPRIKPNVESWRGARIGTMWNAIHENMNGENNSYGLINTDTHLMKNMEWGAVAYLSQSKYGKYGNTTYTGENKGVYRNGSSSYITGNSNGTTRLSNKPKSSYQIEKSGTGASTTGNIYGIYDMSGGASEFVMGVINNGIHIEAIEGIEKRYFDLYEYNESSTIEASAHKGDATYETIFWREGRASFANLQYPFFKRGGSHSLKGAYAAGVFSFQGATENAEVTISSRPALVSLN